MLHPGKRREHFEGKLSELTDVFVASVEAGGAEIDELFRECDSVMAASKQVFSIVDWSAAVDKVQCHDQSGTGPPCQEDQAGQMLSAAHLLPRHHHHKLS